MKIAQKILAASAALAFMGGALLTAQPALANDGYANCNVWIHYEYSVGGTCNSDAPGTEYQVAGKCRHVPTGHEAIVTGPWRWQMPASQGFNTSYANCPAGTRAVQVWRNVR
ncbi:hypothetical protein [Arthrobacter sp. EpRS71]|uniref:hypothetical protein n=1 Tax=Arthrobacter sp. EpRS71 TaxID=1743141 RepID=UPI00074AC430|nr:hypothetical protein [Arthrobacter sp. EpRS71]KUM35169.1 hypothetical protein AR689_13985 [Arthrobacter sp. EpRS71]